jgi:hypothetical protein
LRSWTPAEAAWVSRKKHWPSFANRPLDTVGIQYGLKALMNGQITPAQFVDLNVKVGGHDIDYNFQPQRTVADPAALTVVYRSGYLNQANNLDVPSSTFAAPAMSRSTIPTTAGRCVRASSAPTATTTTRSSGIRLPLPDL